MSEQRVKNNGSKTTRPMNRERGSATSATSGSTKKTWNSTMLNRNPQPRKIKLIQTTIYDHLTDGATALKDQEGSK